ncbi:trypsin-like peptidase domain-containing protein [Cellulomonas sp. WB94]|uniref:S1C family serine protease n=1 Tax=Cellulomonas sp. WB94 TaxID=2173174 RepID=UPI001F5BF149|nr:trypsin-like peptidase domain-containing protein [Cellulomonas sp. WB94]
MTTPEQPTSPEQPTTPEQPANPFAPPSRRAPDPAAPPPSTPYVGAPAPVWGTGYPPPPAVVVAGSAAERPGRRRGLSFGGIALVVVLALVAGAIGGVVGTRLLADDHLVDAGLPAAIGTGAGDRAPESVAGIAARVLPSVVSIQVTGPDGSATGSGFVLRQDGYILTNNHVVAGSDVAGTTIEVLFADGSESAATVVGATADYDLAVVKVDRTGLVPLVLGNSDDVVVGDPVVAVGAPLGLEGTVTTGIVSALNRPVSAGDSSDTAFINAIQTDAAINPGNSGGPLVNAAGEVVGINSAIAQPPGSLSTAGGSIGLGFAITSNQARRTSEQLIETGHATYPIIGVLLDQRYVGEGVQVSTDDQGSTAAVSPGGPADRAGIRRGDVILAIDGRPVTEPDELIVAIRAKTPGDAVVLRVRTASSERDVRVVLDESATS